MSEKQDLPVQQKREVEKEHESTRPMRAYMPTVDIFETEEALTIALEMPGVSKDNVDVGIENGLLTVEGRIDVGKYEGLLPVYSEYNVGPYSRSFRISSRIDPDKIAAEMRDGVMTITLPKGEEAKSRRIKVG